MEDSLIEACLNGHMDVVRHLIERGANIHANEDRALITAALYGHLGIVKFLIEVGANIHADDDGALVGALYYHKLNVLKLLLEHGANVHIDNDYPMRWASCSYNVVEVKLLLEWGANVNVIEETFLVRLIKEYQFDVMDSILRKGLRYKGLNEIICQYIKEYQLKCMSYTELNSKLPDELLKNIAVFI